MNPCIKTGCDVFITSHGTVLHGDLYQLDTMFVLRYGIGQDFNDSPKAIAKCYARFDDAAAELKGYRLGNKPMTINFDTSQWGTLIIHEDYVELKA